MYTVVESSLMRKPWAL